MIQDLVAEMYDSVPDDLHATDRIRFESAVVEIVGNVIEHAQPVQLHGGVRMRVVVSRDERTLRGVVTDDGQSAPVELSTLTMSGLEDVDGRGLAMALALSSDLHYERVAGRNRWIVTCDCT
ncbi:ATP-binding protein [uncultured Jatrophihabitans sp.]|uniref:ATP-binding protein n=1 Tax=uncultured Jatrophihabitans sp. TaxID=1610747 RepID=UPI0035CC2DA3